MMRLTIVLLFVSSLLSCRSTTPPAAAGSEAASTQPAATAERATDAHLREYLERVERLGFSGSVLVARGGQPILHEGYGLADHQKGTPYTTSTASTIGSVTKPFTAVAIMTLVDSGQLSVDDPISKFFPEAPADKGRITVHQLLTHSAGLPGAIGDDLERVGRDEYLRRAFAAPLNFEPGAAYDYSNVGYSILAAMIEKVTGQPYEVALRERVLAPAGLRDTGYQRAGVAPERLAKGVRDGQNWGTIAEKTWGDDGPGWHLVGNGGLLSTTADLFRWQQALHSGRILSEESYRKMIHPWVREGEDADSFYGYGWAIWLDEGGAPRLIAHNGGNGVFHTDLLHWPQEDLVVIGMSNVSDRSFIDISERVGRLARGEEVTMPPAVVDLPPSELAKMEGKWSTTEGGRLETEVTGKRLTLRPLDPVALQAISAPPDERARTILAQMEAMTGPILDAAMAGDYGPMQKAFGGPPLEEVAARGAETRARLESDKGAITGHRVVTSYVDGGRAAVLARLEQERGESYLVYLWGPGGLRGVRLLENFPETQFHPTGPGELASYDFRRGTRVDLTIKGDLLTLKMDGPKTTEARRER